MWPPEVCYIFIIGIIQDLEPAYLHEFSKKTNQKVASSCMFEAEGVVGATPQ